MARCFLVLCINVAYCVIKSSVVDAQCSETDFQVTGLRVENVAVIVEYDLDGLVHVEPSSPFRLRMYGCDMTKIDTVRLTQNATDCTDVSSPVIDVETLKTQMPHSLSFDVKFENEHRHYICIKNKPSTPVIQKALADDKPASKQGDDATGTGGSVSRSARQADSNGTVSEPIGPTSWIHQGHDELKSIVVQRRIKEYYMPMPIQIIIICLLLCLSGLFSGLNLGLMALDKTELAIVMKVGNKTEKMNAEKIYPVRKTGNYLLCSLLLGNVIVNSAISILFDDLTSGFVALVAASFGIVVFGEILPQSICSRYGLAVGARTIYVTKFFMFVTAPLSWPISKLLDFVLGEEVGTVYNRDRLLELIRVSQGADDGLKECQEVQIVSGALELSKKTVGDVMTLIQDVYMVAAESILDTKTVSAIVQSGFTRIPVFEGERPRIKVVGLLNVKDLALLDPDDCIPVQTICQFYRHPVRTVMEDMPLAFMLEEFKKGHYHLAFVERINEDGPGDPFYEMVGLVTLEDIIEEIIQSEIVDETDVIYDNRKKIPRREAQLKDISLLISGGPGGLGPAGQPSHVSPQLSLACFQFLVTSVEPFGQQYISEPVLQRLIRQNVVQATAEETKRSGKPLYERDVSANYFVLILEGRMELTLGDENFLFDAGPFFMFGKQVMEKVCSLAPRLSITVNTQAENLSSRATFTPDYTARITDDVTYLLISAAAYLKAYRATLIQKTKGVGPGKIASMLASMHAAPHTARKGSHPSLGSVGQLFTGADGSVPIDITDSPIVRRSRPTSSGSLRAVSDGTKRRFSEGPVSGKKVKGMGGAGAGSHVTSAAAGALNKKQKRSKSGSQHGTDFPDGLSAPSPGMTPSDSSIDAAGGSSSGGELDGSDRPEHGDSARRNMQIVMNGIPRARPASESQVTSEPMLSNASNDAPRPMFSAMSSDMDGPVGPMERVPLPADRAQHAAGDLSKGEDTTIRTNIETASPYGRSADGGSNISVEGMSSKLPETTFRPSPSTVHPDGSTLVAALKGGKLVPDPSTSTPL